jgi:hypothetical protein
LRCWSSAENPSMPIEEMMRVEVARRSLDYDPRTENGARAESSTGALGEASEGRAEER